MFVGISVKDFGAYVFPSNGGMVIWVGWDAFEAIEIDEAKDGGVSVVLYESGEVLFERRNLRPGKDYIGNPTVAVFHDRRAAEMWRIKNDHQKRVVETLWRVADTD